MLLELKNISAIKEANVKLDGLTVIAGENDTGKSTVGKALFSIIKADNIVCSNKNKIKNISPKSILATRLNLVFDAKISNNGIIVLKKENKNLIKINVEQDNYITVFERYCNHRERFFDATFISSPLVLNLATFFNSVAKMRDRQLMDSPYKQFDKFNIKYPYIFWDLYDKVTNENFFPKSKKIENIQNVINQVIKGEFIVEQNKLIYNKILGTQFEKIPMFNTAEGIKSFGILQLLNKNRYLNKKYLLILDEPEVHLHPKWQLKMAKLIVKLAKEEIKILVTSHSPYMIEALKRYSEIEKIEDKTNFYLAENGYIKQIGNSNSQTVAKIFDKLSEPFELFEQMDSNSLENILNG